MWWVADGLTRREWSTIETLVSVTHSEPDLARLIAGYPWVADGVTSIEKDALNGLLRIVHADPGLARRVLGYAWVADDTDYIELQAFDYLADIAGTDRELANQLGEKPWFADDMTYQEQTALEKLSYIHRRHRSLGRQVSSTIEGNRQIAGLLDSLAYLAVENPDSFWQLMEQPWVSDGLDDEDKAFMVILEDAHKVSRKLYSDLIESRFVQSASITLPLTGKVNLWAFQNVPFQPDEDMTAIMEAAARNIEQFISSPFLTRNLILSVIVESENSDYEFTSSGGHMGSHIRVNRVQNYPLNLHVVYHETAHYFLTSFPAWLIEGWAEFMAAFIRDRTGIQPTKDRRLHLEMTVESGCYAEGFENLHQLGNSEGFYLSLGVSSCNYSFGEYFLSRLYETLGEEALSSALRELYVLIELSDRDYPLTGKEIYLTLLNNTPPGLESEFLDLFRRLHGGPWPDANVDVTDDHGDSASEATGIEVGEVAEGATDHEFDVDYFRFQAEGGQRYNVAINNHTLEYSRIEIYAHDGVSMTHSFVPGPGYAGRNTLWEAPGSHAYYAAVDSPDGSVGSYTLAITPVDIGADDHGARPKAPPR